MKKSILAFIILLLMVRITVQAQTLFYQTFQWKSQPVLHDLDSSMKSYPGVIIKQEKTIEVIRHGGEMATFSTEHKIVRVNNSAGVEKFNRVAIPIAGNRKLIDIKVRAIDPVGKITEFQQQNLRELNNVEGLGSFKIFAIEGLLAGGELEYVYTIKMPMTGYGREVIQKDVPVLESSFEIGYPGEYSYSMKSYNGLPQPVEEQFERGKQRAISVLASNIPAAVEERFSANTGNLMRVDYKLERTHFSPGALSWMSLAERLMASIYDPKGPSKVNFLQSLHLQGTPVDKMRVVENYIKTNFTVKAGNNEGYDDLKQVLANRVGSERGISKLYLACWQALYFSPEVVLSCPRVDGRIDASYSTPLDLDLLHFYFADIKQYITPRIFYLRMGAPPDNIGGGNGLFIRYHFEGEKLVVDRSEVKGIDKIDFEHNQLGVKAGLEFDGKIEDVTISQENFYQGSRASIYRGAYFSAPEGKRNEMLKTITLSGMDNETVISRTLESEGVNESANPDSFFRIKTVYKAPSIVEKAGDDYLIAVGKVTGKQSELYEEKNRKSDVVHQAVAKYHHEITMQIPEGYAVQGLENIKINHAVTDGDKMPMLFTSDYTMDGRKLTITADEVYKVVFLPKEKYEEFRKVINASADFSKLVLILHKE